MNKLIANVCGNVCDFVCVFRNMTKIMFLKIIKTAKLSLFLGFRSFFLFSLSNGQMRLT
jgi:hypothetical protein